MAVPSVPEVSRKPLARIERHDVQRTFRLMETEDREYQDAAVAEGTDFTTYCRDCLRMGHSIKQGQKFMKRAGR